MTIDATASTLFLDVTSGCAGDMFAGALFGLLSPDDTHKVLAELQHAGIPDVKFAVNSTVRGAIACTQMQVLVHGKEEDAHQEDERAGHNGNDTHGQHAHATLGEILDLICGLDLPADVKENACNIYRTIAEAESEVHLRPAGEVHFHEVGAMDAVADICASCLLMHYLSPKSVIATPVHVGSGTVRCAHGILPVPAPATALLLRDIPIYGGTVTGELCTPTGAALLRYFVDSFAGISKDEPFAAKSIGYGAGTRAFDTSGYLRAMMGHTIRCTPSASLDGTSAPSASGSPHNRSSLPEFIKAFVRMADEGWRQGWHECNGGNLSYRMTPKDVSEMQHAMAQGAWMPLAPAANQVLDVPEMAGEFLLITAAGSYFQNIARDASNLTAAIESVHPKTFGIIEIDESGRHYRTCWGFGPDGRPTSELPSHVLNHGVLKQAATPAAAHAEPSAPARVLYHAHPANTIALTFVLPHDSEVFTRELWSAISECRLVFPEGVGVIDWLEPGSAELAEATADLMRTRNAVIWSQHGAMVAGATFDETFGLLHTIEKASEVLVKAKSMQ